MKFASGERVLLEMEGRAVSATVILASGNGRSLMLSFEALLDGCVGMMPVSDNVGTGQFINIMTGHSLTIRQGYKCPRCQRVSFNPKDAAERYCGACHTFAEDAT